VISACSVTVSGGGRVLGSGSGAGRELGVGVDTGEGVLVLVQGYERVSTGITLVIIVSRVIVDI
jgi:hypothetical protein